MNEDIHYAPFFFNTDTVILAFVMVEDGDFPPQRAMDLNMRAILEVIDSPVVTEEAKHCNWPVVGDRAVWEEFRQAYPLVPFKIVNLTVNQAHGVIRRPWGHLSRRERG